MIGGSSMSTIIIATISEHITLHQALLVSWFTCFISNLQNHPEHQGIIEHILHDKRMTPISVSQKLKQNCTGKTPFSPLITTLYLFLPFSQTEKTSLNYINYILHQLQLLFRSSNGEVYRGTNLAEEEIGGRTEGGGVSDYFPRFLHVKSPKAGCIS